MKAGKIIESSGKSVENKSYPGLFECVLEHKVAETGANFQWSGPRITPEMWSQVLAFFQWTYNEHKSEAQVRLFVHPDKGWMAWAFPQKGGTSLTTKEEDNEDAKKQRAEQIPEGFVAFGTVHHHCSISAFQSSTDTDDEKSVDGLHITVGNMDKEKFTMHARLYLKGNKFEPDMSAFWDIGKDFIEKILFVAELGFSITELTDKTARNQMCIPVPITSQFPKLWHDNYIIEKPVVTTYGSQQSRYGGRYEWQGGHIAYNGHNGSQQSGHGSQGLVDPKGTNLGDDKEGKTTHEIKKEVFTRSKREKKNMSIGDVLDDIQTVAAATYTTDEELNRILEFMGNDIEFKMIQSIVDILHHTRFSLQDVWDEWERRVVEAEAKEAMESDGGIPPHTGGEFMRRQITD